MSELQSQLDTLHDRLRAGALEVRDAEALEELRVRFLGRSGEVTLARRGIGALPADERPSAGKRINDVVAQMEALLEEASARIARGSLDAELAHRIDVTFPAPDAPLGSIHPVRRIIEEIAATFAHLGFTVVLGAEVEPSYYTFDALNIPGDHPAREGFDSFFITPSLLLRPHTSPMQIRTMQQHKPPIAILAPGRCYRRDAVDARHLFQFHQIEGLLVAEGVNFGHLKGALAHLCRSLFGAEQRVRFRPSFFPFTEPSAEVDTTCPKCRANGESCAMCGGSGWIEIGGAGMVHPNVLREVGYDPAQISGWAFGVGVERIALARYEIDDIRRLIECDTDFLRQLQ
ncbi:MAG TPA: phenylalanine--tRNA ligase subunit alpha [Candidatus Dormibacteraeota bacterium]|nr:phenylalanine--tRNA ligase subunit alpha [Candidatus Dormibacteraeota bacterium]